MARRRQRASSLLDEHCHASPGEEGKHETDVSSVASIAEENEEEKGTIELDDDDNWLEVVLYQRKLRRAMQRNILKRNLSEDLIWADILVNDQEYAGSCCGQNQNTMQVSSCTKSLHSTPERCKDIPSEEQEAKVDSGREPRKIPSMNAEKNSSSNSNLSEKSRISSVVYPSRLKKNPVERGG